MDLMPGEKILFRFSNEVLTVTTHRVRKSTKYSGGAVLISIMLEDLVASSITAESSPGLLVIAAILALFGVFFTAGLPGNPPAPALLGVVFGAVFLLVYFTSKKQYLVLASAALRITVNTQGLKYADVKQSVDRIEAAKNERYLLRREN